MASSYCLALLHFNFEDSHEHFFCRASLVIMNSPDFCLSGDVFIRVLHFWKKVFLAVIVFSVGSVCLFACSLVCLFVEHFKYITPVPSGMQGF